MVTRATKEASGVFRALSSALNDAQYGKINACYVIAALTGEDFKKSIARFKAARQASPASDKQALYAARLLDRARLDDARFQDLRIYLETYPAIVADMGIKPRTWTRKTWRRIESPGCYGTEEAAPELGENF